MPCRKITAKVKRKMGRFYGAYACPYCGKNHWNRGGCYTESESTAIGFIKTPCGHNIELVREKAKRRQQESKKLEVRSKK